MTSRQDEENHAEAQDPPSPVLEDQAPPPEPQPVDPIQAAEKVKEQGNALFKAGKLAEAIQKYTEAIGAHYYSAAPGHTSLLMLICPRPCILDLNPNEPTYLTNRAAAYMALKKFKPALADCQQAPNLQADAPSVKTLTRLARCQLSTGSTAPALQLQKKVLEAHLRNSEGAKKRRNWAMARLALDKCVQSIEAEGGDIPIQWRCWKVEMELSRGNWDAASIAAKWVAVWARGLCTLTYVPYKATRFGWSPTHPTCSRCAGS